MDKTLLKGLKVLERLALSSSPKGVSELAQELGMTRSNAHRTLQTLVAAGLARQDSAGQYECTLKLFELASGVVSRLDVSRVAEPAIQRLAQQTQETVHLSVLDGLDVIYLQKLDSPQPVRAYTSIGGRAPAYCVATGKAILAFQGEAYLERFRGHLQAHTRHTIINPEALSEELRQIRELGYAINRGEWRESVHGLAAPVFNANSKTVAAIGISGPADRLRPLQLRQLSGLVVAAAREVSEALGNRRS